MIEKSRDEEVCRAWDVLAEQDHASHVSEEEYFHYRQTWWISLYKSGNDTQPVRKRSDFNRALSQEAGGQQLGPMPDWKYQPGGLPKNSKKVKKEATRKGLRSNGATCCLQNFGENLRRMTFTNLGYRLS